MKVIKKREELQRTLEEMRDGKCVGYVATMGGLHDGHKSLVERSLEECDLTVVSVFLNPTQFNDPTDYETYPHDTEADLALLEAVGADIVFLPTPEEMYEEGEKAPEYDLGSVAEVMEGARRPGHFEGVVWVVSKFFRLIQPDKAYFGLKDFQQIAVLKRMIELSPDMHGIEIVPCPVIREADGLAMSSRNNRLSPEERKAAAKIYAALVEGVAMKRAGKSVEETHRGVVEMINNDPLLEVEYFSIVDGRTLLDIDEWQEDAVGCITVYCGDKGVRLIDHIDF